MFNMYGFIGQRTGIKSVQQFTIALTSVNSNTRTIVSVDVANSLLIYNGISIADASILGTENLIRLALTNATTVTATRQGSTNAGTRTVAFTVVEFYPGVLKSVQYDTVTLGASASGTKAITAVDVTKSVILPLGFESTNASSVTGQSAPWLRWALTSSVLVTATMDTGFTNMTAGFCVAEFY